MNEIVVSIVIPYLDFDATKKLILHKNNNLIKNNNNVEMIVVDNNLESPGLKELCEKLKVRYVFEKNKSRSKARNFGARLARGIFILHLDDNSLMNSKSFTGMLDFVTKYPDLDIVQLKIIHQKRSKKNDMIFDFFYFNYRFSEKRAISNSMTFIDTAGLLIKREKSLLIGGLDESLDRYEDRDLSYRVKEYKLIYKFLPNIFISKIVGPKGLIDFLETELEDYKYCLKSNLNNYSMLDVLRHEIGKFLSSLNLSKIRYMINGKGRPSLIILGSLLSFARFIIFPYFFSKILIEKKFKSQLSILG